MKGKIKRGITYHLPDFIAIVAIVLLASGVATYILSHQRFYLPSWVPVVGKDFYTVYAQFETAQAVMPGQGQTVAIAGVPIGDLTKVRLDDGVAIIEMKIKRRYAPIYKDADMLLRPKTGLNDMFIQLNPGTKKAGEVPDGGTVPVKNSMPNVNPEEVWAMLDADTRDYLLMLITNGGQGLKGQGGNLGQAFRQLSTTSELGHKITTALEDRRENIRRSIHNFRLVAEELGNNDKQLATWVESANELFGTYARHDQDLRKIFAKAPGALREMNGALKATQATLDQATPAFKKLKPFGENLGDALRRSRPFLRDTKPVIRDRLRPFARETAPIVADLRPAARDLKQLTPSLTGAGKTINRLLDVLDYNPPGAQEGYMFWLAWLNHNASSVFSTQDAHSPLRRGTVVATCNDLLTIKGATRVGGPYELVRMIALMAGLPEHSNCQPGDN